MSARPEPSPAPSPVPSPTVRPLSVEAIEADLRRRLRHPDPEDDPMPVATHGPMPDPPPLRVRPLLALGDAAFVSACYRGMLGREPDRTGLRGHLDALAAGMPKLDMVVALHAGEEARARGAALPDLPGLLRQRLWRRRLLRLTGMGPALDRVLGRLGAARRHQRALEAMTRAMTALQDHVAATEARRDAREAEVATGAEARALRERVDALARTMADEPWLEMAGAVAKRLAEHDALLSRAGDFAAIGGALEHARTELGWREEGAALAARLGELVRDSQRRVARAETAAAEALEEMRAQRQRIGLLIGELRRARTLPDAERALETAREADLDALYVAFEDRFRGSRDMIKARQRAHLPLLREAGAGTAAAPVLDVGSGRGEWLELLADEGLAARGVDLNASMARACAERGLACETGDAVAYLAALPPDSLGAVTGFHIIEHLPFGAMVALFDAALRALRPGGIILFETPNPANLLVGSRWFYLDPTHRNPLPGEMVSMIAEARGFGGVEIRPMHPMETRFAGDDRVLAEQLDALFHGPQDYALVGRKPAEATGRKPGSAPA